VVACNDPSLNKIQQLMVINSMNNFASVNKPVSSSPSTQNPVANDTELNPFHMLAEITNQYNVCCRLSYFMLLGGCGRTGRAGSCMLS